MLRFLHDWVSPDPTAFNSHPGSEPASYPPVSREALIARRWLALILFGLWYTAKKVRTAQNGGVTSAPVTPQKAKSPKLVDGHQFKIVRGHIRKALVWSRQINARAAKPQNLPERLTLFAIRS
jgi:hypothetical protein